MLKPKISSYEKRTAWFHQARFGMFIHWGLYSLLGRGECVMWAERIPVKEYAKLADRFTPARFDVDRWVSLAKAAGMKYVVFTAQHHDGFALYDSKASDFTSVKTAAKKDFVAAYVKSCRKYGLKVGLYYSLPDWRFPGYFNLGKYPQSFKAMIKQAHSQVRELMTNYGKIDYLWYDDFCDRLWIPDGEPISSTMEAGGSPEIPKLWHSKQLNQMARSLQPQIMINNRSGLEEDLDTPEQAIAVSKPGRAWESCMTMGDFCGWGYIKNNPNFKTTTQLIQNLVTTASGAGNYLLNIGPKPDGTVRAEEVTRLKEIGKWMQVNGESIYGSERLPDRWGGVWGCGMLGAATVRGNNAYLHIFRWPGETVAVAGIKNKVLAATILATGRKAKIEQTKDGRLFLKGLPKEPPDRNDTVIRLKLDGKPKPFNYSGMPL
ncbi:MAG: alpha-L-fucosidase [Verrucomicrobia bacterium]|nr:alpha-L-fucosidase [Verrucomicrobiota bacterium]MBU1733714.1 alpha-L-fucosidase [Verrucomicrobiota bacterium]